MNLFVHYDVEDLDYYLQVDSDPVVQIGYTQDEDDPCRYYITLSDFQDLDLPAGVYHPSVRQGSVDYPDPTDPIRDAFELRWNGNVALTDSSGGGTLSARIGIVSLTTNDFLEIVQGEEKVITLIVEAHGRFVSAIADAIVVKFQDTEGTSITKTEETEGVITRVCQSEDVQVLRCLLTAEDTESLVDGLLDIEIAFDSQKARLSHSLKVIEQL